MSSTFYQIQFFIDHCYQWSSLNNHHYHKCLTMGQWIKAFNYEMHNHHNNAARGRMYRLVRRDDYKTLKVIRRMRCPQL